MSSIVRFRLACSLCVLSLFSVAVARPVHASSPEEVLLDANALTDLEAKAAAAEPRERCFLYTELLHSWTELAGRSIASGDDAAAIAAMQRADADAGKLKAAIGRDSKRLKTAEELLEHSVHRLSDMVRVASMDQHEAMQAVLRHVSSVHDELLAAVFAH